MHSRFAGMENNTEEVFGIAARAAEIHKDNPNARRIPTTAARASPVHSAAKPPHGVGGEEVAEGIDGVAIPVSVEFGIEGWDEGGSLAECEAEAEYSFARPTANSAAAARNLLSAVDLVAIGADPLEVAEGASIDFNGWYDYFRSRHVYLDALQLVYTNPQQALIHNKEYLGLLPKKRYNLVSSLYNSQ